MNIRSLPSYWSLAALACVLTISGLAQSVQQANVPYLRKGLLSPRNRDVIRALGDRLEVSGKERVVMTGTLTSPSLKSPATIQITSEWPGLLRVDGLPNGAIVFKSNNGNGVGKANGQAGKQDEDLVNSFVLDFVDHYLLGQSQGTPTRYLGPALVNDLSITKTMWNMVEVGDTIQSQGKPSQVLKYYGFNAQTGLLENVAYSLKGTNTETHVQVRFSNWKLFQQEWLPGNIARLEDSASSFNFVLVSATVGPKVADGAFDHP